MQMSTPSSSLAAVVEAFAAGDITAETIGCVKEEMRGASIEEQYAVLNALRNACTTTEMATMQAFVDLFSCDEAAPGLLEFFSEKVASEPPKSRPIPQADGEESTDLMRAGNPNPNPNPNRNPDPNPNPNPNPNNYPVSCAQRWLATWLCCRACSSLGRLWTRCGPTAARP